MARSRQWLAASLCLALATSCAGKPTTGVKPHASSGPVAAGEVHYAPLAEKPLAVVQQGDATELVGKVKLLSEHGAGVISNNSGGLISNNGGGIVSEHGGGIVSEAGGSLIGKTKYRVQQAAAPAEALLADARIEVLDAQGHYLTDDKGQPLGTTSDGSGAYSLKAVLPDENLVLRVRLFNGGQLLAVLPRGSNGATRDLGTSSSLAASYVLDQYVKGQQAVYDRLPAAEATGLEREIETARGGLAALPSYQPQELVSSLEKLRASAAPVSESLDRIKAILLVGQGNYGAGRKATDVALSGPVQVLQGDGGILIVEGPIGRLRLLKTAADGSQTLDVVAGAAAVSGTEAMTTAFTTVVGVARLADGSLVLSENALNRVRKIDPQGRVTTLMGNGDTVQGAVEVPADGDQIDGPTDVCAAADGTIYVAENPKFEGLFGRVLRIDPQGIVHDEQLPHLGQTSTQVPGLALAADGTLFAAIRTGQLLMKAPGGDWKILLKGLALDATNTHLTADGDAVLVGESAGQRVLSVSRDGQVTVLAGTGKPGYLGDGGPATAALLNQPCGAWRAADGTLYIADTGNGVVRAVGADGKIRTVAGAQGLTQVGDAQAVAINQPTALAFDGQGRLLIAESGSSQVKRLDGGKVTVVAGTSQGFDGDGGPATDAKLNQPSGLAFRDGNLLIMDTTNQRLRQVDAAGLISTLAGGDGVVYNGSDMPALGTHLVKPLGVVVGPDRCLYWTDLTLNMVVKLTQDGRLQRVAGNLDGQAGDDGDGGPALNAHFSSPFALAFGPDGELYVVDAANVRIRVIGKDGVISPFAGLGQAGTAARAFAGTLDHDDDGTPAAEAFLALPSSILLDGKGHMYVAEGGTANFQGLSSLSGLSLGGLPRVLARIRRIDLADPKHPITTVAGPGTHLLNDPANDDSLRLPTAMALDPQGRLVIADGGSNQVKLLPAGSF